MAKAKQLKKLGPPSPLVQRMVATGLSRIAAETLQGRLPEAARAMLLNIDPSEFYAKLQEVRELVNAAIIGTQRQAIAQVEAAAAETFESVSETIAPQTEIAEPAADIIQVESVPEAAVDAGQVNSPPNGDG